ncbi:unnamed protein product [Bursaphelenchus xylophilus]|uniref:(pine wood nematode) hypothetical protein n=1 Tax=Bursaphelenchus xylophilus TaxID=6326 RepID=A0A1I7RMI5_BURXY|nr:unnamed protein product [Bursaphelenchus xylophilus]CAG9118523.1 unnamed protein product [Bursaphelenchus xylophilus]
MAVKGILTSQLTYDGLTVMNKILVLSEKGTTLLCGKALKDFGIMVPDQEKASVVHRTALPLFLAVKDQVNAEMDCRPENGTLVNVDTVEWTAPIAVVLREFLDSRSFKYMERQASTLTSDFQLAPTEDI